MRFMKMNKKMIKHLISLFGFRIIRIDPTTERNSDKLSSEIKDKDYFRLQEEFSTYSLHKIHFGCGPCLKGFGFGVSDLSYEPYENYLASYGNKYYPPEIRGNRSDLYALDITKNGLPIPDNSVDVIFHEDFIEHLCQRDQILFLAETHRILKKGGVHRVNTPNLLSSMDDHSDFSKGFNGIYVDEWDRWHHLNILSPQSLKEMALLVGYSSVIFNSRDQSLVKECLPLEYRPGPDRSENGNIFADMIK